MVVSSLQVLSPGTQDFFTLEVKFLPIRVQSKLEVWLEVRHCSLDSCSNNYFLNSSFLLFSAHFETLFFKQILFFLKTKIFIQLSRVVRFGPSILTVTFGSQHLTIRQICTSDFVSDPWIVRHHAGPWSSQFVVQKCSKFFSPKILANIFYAADPDVTEVTTDPA